MGSTSRWRGRFRLSWLIVTHQNPIPTKLIPVISMPPFRGRSGWRGCSAVDGILGVLRLVVEVVSLGRKLAW